MATFFTSQQIQICNSNAILQHSQYQATCQTAVLKVLEERDEKIVLFHLFHWSIWSSLKDFNDMCRPLGALSFRPDQQVAGLEEASTLDGD